MYCLVGLVGEYFVFRGKYLAALILLVAAVIRSPKPSAVRDLYRGAGLEYAQIHAVRRLSFFVYDFLQVRRGFRSYAVGKFLGYVVRRRRFRKRRRKRRRRQKTG